MTLRLARRLWRGRGFGFLFRRQSQIQRRHLPSDFLAHFADYLIGLLNIPLRLLLRFEAQAVPFDFLAATPAAGDDAKHGKKDDR